MILASTQCEICPRWDEVILIVRSIEKVEIHVSYEKTELFVLRLCDMYNKPDITIADEILAPHFVAHFPLAPSLTRSSFKNYIGAFYDAFSDFKVEIDQSIVTNNQLILRVTFSGTHAGNFLGISATGCHVTMPGISIFHIENNLVVENWTEIDMFGVLRQISYEIKSEVNYQYSASHN